MFTGPWQYQRVNPYLHGLWTVTLSTGQSVYVWLLDRDNVNESIHISMTIGP